MGVRYIGSKARVADDHWSNDQLGAHFTGSIVNLAENQSTHTSDKVNRRQSPNPARSAIQKVRVKVALRE